ncbi:MAG: hypothetical protein QOG52_1691 [Frankiaceae bacterium]|jgi:hypothetical protein|nr:hypothetical protein [Frankiaceae bacterium]
MVAAWSRSVASRYGEPQNCFLDGDLWVVTTDAGPEHRSAMGIDLCRNAACLDGAVDHGGDNSALTRPVSGRIKYDGASGHPPWTCASAD